MTTGTQTPSRQELLFADLNKCLDQLVVHTDPETDASSAVTGTYFTVESKPTTPYDQQTNYTYVQVIVRSRENDGNPAEVRELGDVVLRLFNDSMGKTPYRTATLRFDRSGRTGMADFELVHCKPMRPYYVRAFSVVPLGQ